MLLAVAIYLTLAFISYFTTGMADQTAIESPRAGEIINENFEFQNKCGSLGAYISYFFMKQCFGLAAFFIPVFLMFSALNMMRVFDIKLWKWFFALVVVMLWLSVAMAKFLSPFFADSFFNPGGDHGLFVCQRCEGLTGAPGLMVILATTAIAFMMYLSVETINFIRKLLNPAHYFKKIPFTVHSGESKADDAENQNDTEEQPVEIFDDPSSQEIDFGKGDKDETPKIKDDGYADGGKTGKDGDSDDVEIEINDTKEEEKADGPELVEVGDKMLSPYDPKKDLENYRYPTLDLLDRHDNGGRSYIDMEEQNANKNRIVDVLRTFGVEINSIKATVGPTITLYEITLKEGVRISKVRSLEDDIALSLAAL
ncbi:MAG: DNA translocase FtsK 4TM domain-containing protein, partial [Prevotella sp.]|nr:DNA translocase FtsK 4TM domain-containing protein [Prevotella sp.]